MELKKSGKYIIEAAAIVLTLHGPRNILFADQPELVYMEEIPSIVEQLPQIQLSDIERTINDMYERCLKSYSIDGQEILLRIPFGQSEERSKNRNFTQRIFKDGKGTPEEIWQKIDEVLLSPTFAKYMKDISSVDEYSQGKVIIYNLKNAGYSVKYDKKLVDRMKNGKYPGDDATIYVLRTDSNIKVVEIYNYLYCIASIGMHCSGFVYNVEESIASNIGYSLDSLIAEELGVPQDNIGFYISTKFFDPRNGHTTRVDEKISNLRPSDIILFMGKENQYKHSAVIQSIDFEQGVIRYMQSTDWAPQSERGVHESFIYFNPANPGVNLKDKSLRWTQEVHPTFIGEQANVWKNDGDRYISYQQYGGSIIVRLNALKKIIEQEIPDYYMPRKL